MKQRERNREKVRNRERETERETHRESIIFQLRHILHHDVVQSNARVILIFLVLTSCMTA